MTPRATTAFALAASLCVASLATADTYVLSGGDRITGKTLLKATKTFRVQTPYGRLVIPRSKVERILHDDGTEEVVNATAPAAPATPPVRMVLVITGKSFWHAWPKGSSVDPTLRLEVRLDEESVVSYVDARQDPEDLPGAIVNTFNFDAQSMKATTAAAGAQVDDAETRPGRIVLKIDLPAEMAGKHRLRLAYQVNDGAAAEPAWRDAAATSVDVELQDGAASVLQVRQDPGRMEFSGFTKKKMKNVETFRLEATSQAPE
jgi:hypothetical protein